jgi:hypothetical protein
MPSLIVLGHARSGTTALLNFINNHKLCAISGELNVHYLASLKSELEISQEIETWRSKKFLELANLPNMIEFYSSQIPHIPYSPKDSGRIIETIKSGKIESGLQLEWIGDKIATAYRTFPNGKTDLELLRTFVPDFLQANSSNLMFLTFRRPTLTFLSTIKMFPYMPLNDVIEHYCELFDYQIELLKIERCVPVIWECHSMKNSMEILSLLGIDRSDRHQKNYNLINRITFAQRMENKRRLRGAPRQVRNRLKQMDAVYDTFLFEAKSNSCLGLFEVKMNTLSRFPPDDFK